MDDLISRAAAIDEIRKCRFVVDAVEKIRGLPSAQPELIEKASYIRGFKQGRTQGMIDSQGGKK